MKVYQLNRSNRDKNNDSLAIELVNMSCENVIKCKNVY